jgi:hypothetical protein
MERWTWHTWSWMFLKYYRIPEHHLRRILGSCLRHRDRERGEDWRFASSSAYLSARRQLPNFEWIMTWQRGRLKRSWANNLYTQHLLWALSSVVDETLCYIPEDRWLDTQWGNWILWIYPIPPAALGPGVYSVPNRNKKCAWGVERGRCVKLMPTPSMSWLCRQCGILNISQSDRPPRPAAGIALLYFT